MTVKLSAFVEGGIWFEAETIDALGDFITADPDASGDLLSSRQAFLLCEVPDDEGADPFGDLVRRAVDEYIQRHSAPAYRYVNKLVAALADGPMTRTGINKNVFRSNKPARYATLAEFLDAVTAQATKSGQVISWTFGGRPPTWYGLPGDYVAGVPEQAVARLTRLTPAQIAKVYTMYFEQGIIDIETIAEKVLGKGHGSSRMVQDLIKAEKVRRAVLAQTPEQQADDGFTQLCRVMGVIGLQESKPPAEVIKPPAESPTARRLRMPRPDARCWKRRAERLQTVVTFCYRPWWRTSSHALRYPENRAPRDRKTLGGSAAVLDAGERPARATRLEAPFTVVGDGHSLVVELVAVGRVRNRPQGSEISDQRGGRPDRPIFRSQSPDLIQQEHAAWVAATEIVRATARAAARRAARAAKGTRVGQPAHPREISFTAARRAAPAVLTPADRATPAARS